MKKESKAVKWTLIVISALFLLLMLILPLIYVFSVAFQDGWHAFASSISDVYARKSICLTLEVTVITVIFNTIFGLCAAWLITRFNFKGKKLLSSLIELPLTISPVIAGLIFLLTFGRQSILYPLLQKMGIEIIFAVPGIVLATIFVTFPFISREIIPVLNAEGTDEEEAAVLMGARGFSVFWNVTLPKIKWALLYGIVLCSARAMGEFGAVSVISGHLIGKTTTMPLYIEILYQGYDFTGAFAVSAILVVIAVILLILRNVIERKGGKELEDVK